MDLSPPTSAVHDWMGGRGWLGGGDAQSTIFLQSERSLESYTRITLHTTGSRRDVPCDTFAVPGKTSAAPKHQTPSQNDELSTVVRPLSPVD